MTAIRHHTVHANGIRQHYMEAGDGPPVVLLHGFPETSYAWRNQIPVLAERYRVIAPDLRGYGETDKPAAGYDKRMMALDLIELMKTLGIAKIALVGHDRGARVATRFAKDHSDLLDRLVVIDNVPTRIVARNMNAQTAKAYWFFLFHLVPDLPEVLIAGRENLWLRHFFSDWCYNPQTISGEAFETYVQAYRRPGAVRGAMADYRANREDVAQDQVDAEVKITCPLLAFGEPTLKQSARCSICQRSGQKMRTTTCRADRAMRPPSPRGATGARERSPDRVPGRMGRLTAAALA